MNMIAKYKLIFGAAILGFMAAGTAQAAERQSATFKKASATIIGVSTSGVSGQLNFAQSSGAVQITGEIRGLLPSASHGFHVHETGDCSDPLIAKSAGAHFNPGNLAHGGPQTHEHHAGDLGNIRSDKNGVAKLNMKTSELSLEGKNAILNRAIVVHANPDDLKTQPSGASGDPVGCGVIQETR